MYSKKLKIKNKIRILLVINDVILEINWNIFLMQIFMEKWNEKINIIQFLPYFPPHKWWLEIVAEEFSYFYVKNWYWNLINIIFDVRQEINNKSVNLNEINYIELIKNKSWNIIWYRQKGYIVYLLPSFDLISNFPFPKFWKKQFWEVLKIPVSQTDKGVKIIIQTHTRFFISSLLGWLFAKFHKLKWIHIEHWSDYVKLWSKFKSKISYIYDRIIWKWIFKKADRIVAISNWVKDFVQKEFIRKKEIDLVYNWINFTPKTKIYNWNIIKIWFVWRLVKLKWVDLLLEVFKNLSKKFNNIELEILWDWEEKISLEKYVFDNDLRNINFLWFKDREYIANEFLPKIDILLNPSFQEWLPTTVLEGLLSECVVVATNVWWTKEISSFEDLIIVDSWNIESLEKWLEKAVLNYKEYRGKSYKYVKENFDWNKSIENYFNLYKEL